jgi:2,3-bisphosphoglycerate-independent phosphoglycerate mutase
MDPVEYIKENHKKDIGDEFIEPACFNKEAIIKDGDVVIFFNFRSDRAREITRALMDNELKELNRNVFPKIRHFLCMTEYDANFVLPVAFPKQNLKNIMGEVISKQGLKQLRIAETEKYAHVTFFFNGGVETPFAGEDRVLVDSPKDVATYDLKPEMSAYKVTEKLLSELDKNIYDLVVVNYANCDMVGHTGVFDAAVKAVETVDECSSVIIKKVLEKNGTVFLTADHGNAEKMKDHDQAHTAHTTNDVRFIIIDKHINKDKISLENGRLADIMPSILDWMNIRIPDEVSGKSLIIKR